MRHAEKKYRPDKTAELKHYEFRRLRPLKCELVTRTLVLCYMKKLNGCGKYSSNIYGQLNVLLGKNKSSNILPSEKFFFHQQTILRIFNIDKIDKIKRGFQNYHKSEDIFSILDSPKIPCIFQLLSLSKKYSPSSKKNNKTSCRHDAIDIFFLSGTIGITS